MSHHLLSLLSCYLLSFSFCNTFGQSLRLAQATKELHVTVMAADDNTPIPEARVYAEGNTVAALFNGTSDQSGKARLILQSGGNLTVSVNHPKFYSAQQTIKVNHYGDQKIYVLEFRLKRKKEAEKLSNVLNVRVTDASMKPIAGALVAVSPGLAEFTNSSGIAKAGHRQLPGEYVVVTVSANGYRDQRKKVLVGAGQGNAITRPVDQASFILEKGDNDRMILHLLVEVLNSETNEPVNGANVKLQSTDGTDEAGTTNAKGEFKFTDMEYGYGGTGKVIVTHPDYEEKWSNIPGELMTAKDMDVRRFVVFVSKNARTFAGTWSTPWGDMVIQQNGNSVQGSYPHDKGKIQGTVNGNILIGTWSEAPSYSQPHDGGQIEFKLTSASTFSGNWRYGSSEPWKSGWDGAKKKL
jgi:hypothetical protein